MEYTIQRLAELAGVTTRTLRWYDKLGLLKPNRIADNGYRCYGGKEVDRLQQIMFYRALGVELAQIKAILDDPSFDRLEALRGHLNDLQAEEAKIQGLIRTVKETILAAERSEIMSDEAKFAAFKRRAVEENERRYGKEIREKYGDKVVDQAHTDVLNLTREQYREWSELGDTIKKKLEQAVLAQADPAGEAGQELAQLHRRWLSFSTSSPYDPAKHRGIAQLYVMDERFQQYYDGNVSGCAQFLRDAVCHWGR